MAFIKNHLPESTLKVEGYLISDKMSIDDGTRYMIEAMRSKDIYVKSYSDLLQEARRYNKKLYAKYDEIETAKK